MSSASAALRRRRRLRSRVIFVAEVTGLIALAGTIMSLVFNVVLFWSWGLSFLAIATASDVFLSGIASALSVATLTAIPAIIFLTAAGPRAKWGTATFQPTISILLSILTVALIISALFFCIYYFELSSALMSLSLLSMAISFLAGDLIRIKFVSPTSISWQRRILTVMAVLVLSTIVALVPQVNKAGLLETGGLYVVERYEGCLLRRVVWLGESSAVLKCFAGDDNRDYLIVDRQNVTIAHPAEGRPSDWGRRLEDAQPNVLPANDLESSDVRRQLP